MLDLILQWARYDGLISQWLLYAYGLSIDGGSILLGNMDTRTKLERLKGLYEHHGMTAAVGRIAELQKAHLSLVGIRNLIAHAGCGGMDADKPWMAVFAPVKAHKGSPGLMISESIGFSAMQTAERFAREMANQLYEFTNPLLVRLSEPPPEPPEFLGGPRPKPRKKRESKRKRQPRSSRDGSPLRLVRRPVPTRLPLPACFLKYIIAAAPPMRRFCTAGSRTALAQSDKHARQCEHSEHWRNEWD